MRVALQPRRSCRRRRAGVGAGVPAHRVARVAAGRSLRAARQARVALASLPATLNPIARRRAAPLAAYVLPKLYRKVYYSISAAIHSKARRREARRSHAPGWRAPRLCCV
jgi:ribosomal protein S26